MDRFCVHTKKKIEWQLSLYIHLYLPERQQQQVKKAPNTQQQKQTNKRERKLRSNRAG